MPSTTVQTLLDTVKTFWSQPSWDIIALLALFGVVFFYGMWAGKRRIEVSILYTYVALAVFSAVPIEALSRVIVLHDRFLLQAGAFLILWILLTVALNLGRPVGFRWGGSLLQTIVLSIVQSGLLFHSILGFLPAERVAKLAPLTKALFTSLRWEPWWFLGPLALVIVLRWFERRDEG
jgi:hypothetical protein